MMYGLYNDYGGWGGSSMMGWYGGGVMVIAFWVLFIAFVVWIVRELGRKITHSNSSSLEILKERYAKGEIDKKEFEEKKKDLLV